MLPFIALDGNEESLNASQLAESLPILALKNTVLFPSNVLPITIGRDRSIRAIEKSHGGDKLIAVFSQKDTKVEDPGDEDLFRFGTVAKLIRMLKMPDGSTTAILRGVQRVERVSMTGTEPILEGEVRPLDHDEISDQMTFEATVASVLDHAKKAIELSPNLPSEAAMVLDNIEDRSFLLNFIAGNLNMNVEQKQGVLEENSLEAKATSLLGQIQKELQFLELRDQIENKTRGDIEKQQRNYYLNQQMKAIQEELGQNPQKDDVDRLNKRAKEKDWPETVAKVFERELDRLKRMNPQVAEFSVQLSYLETLLDLPWNETTADDFDLQKVEKVLDDDHYGLEKIKDRILSHLAVLKLKGDMKAPILLLLGPPGVGKTSLGKSVARALGRKYIRISLGGLHDESEIRGHRKTYIGAMPGRIVQSLKKAGTSNPVFILDEIDKVGNSHRGDPSSALLEVLDPEQNDSFHDNYLDVDVDLSKVLFIATANNINSIQPALRDRMEIISVSGYSEEEKLEIAKRHLLSKQRKEHGLKASQVKIPIATLRAIISNYTRESGVRNLDRRLAGIMRYVAKQIAMEKATSVNVTADLLHEALGPRPFESEKYEDAKVPGVAIGLAWTSVGGSILFIEARTHPGNGKMQQTGSLGDVMKESALTALTYLKSKAGDLDIELERFAKTDIHLHVPEGATPKDGPSAGITMLTALASAFTGRSVKPNVAMTGEITLRGKVLPVGGIKEKLLAARRAGMKEIILSSANRKHVSEIEERYLKQLKIHYVDRMDEVLELALV
ncbi:endopeptidase La [Lewinellaceae bacterium SD302]|nr:endopeptidase La [Lewinellaceae bacterium SD302]